MLPGRDLVIALILGVLLPAIIARPAFLESHPMRPHMRARWTFLYSVFAFAAAAFVYLSTTAVLDRAARLSGAERGALNGAGLLIFLLLCGHHLPPLLSIDKTATVRFAQVTLAVVLGVLMGGFFAADSLWPKSWADTPPIAYASWMLVLAAAFATSCWFSGLSPEGQRAVYRLRARRGRRRLADRGRRSTQNR